MPICSKAGEKIDPFTLIVQQASIVLQKFDITRMANWAMWQRAARQFWQVSVKGRLTSRYSRNRKAAVRISMLPQAVSWPSDKYRDSTIRQQITKMMQSQVTGPFLNLPVNSPKPSPLLVMNRKIMSKLTETAVIAANELKAQSSVLLGSVYLKCRPAQKNMLKQLNKNKVRNNYLSMNWPTPTRQTTRRDRKQTMIATNSHNTSTNNIIFMLLMNEWVYPSARMFLGTTSIVPVRTRPCVWLSGGYRQFRILTDGGKLQPFMNRHERNGLKYKLTNSSSARLKKVNCSTPKSYSPTILPLISAKKRPAQLPIAAAVAIFSRYSQVRHCVGSSHCSHTELLLQILQAQCTFLQVQQTPSSKKQPGRHLVHRNEPVSLLHSSHKSSYSWQKVHFSPLSFVLSRISQMLTLSQVVPQLLGIPAPHNASVVEFVQAMKSQVQLITLQLCGWLSLMMTLPLSVTQKPEEDRG